MALLNVFENSIFYYSKTVTCELLLGAVDVHSDLRSIPNSNPACFSPTQYPCPENQANLEKELQK